MRILKLNIGSYKMFNPSPEIKLGKELQLFIGINGSGKSSIIEAIAKIFSEVKEYAQDGKMHEREMHFNMEYTFTTNEVIEETSTTQETVTTINHIYLSSSSENGLRYTMNVNEKPITNYKDLLKYLPDNLIFYYAGFCSSLEAIVAKGELQQANDLYDLKNQENSFEILKQFSKNITYIRRDYYPLLFILNYIDDLQVLPLTKKIFTIDNIRFNFKKPEKFRNEDYKSFYNIQGILKVFLDKLVESGNELEEIKEGKKHIGATMNIGLFRSLLEVVEDLPNMPQNHRYENTRYYAFHLITLLFRIDILKSISVSIRDEQGKKYSINDFSEGEQQLVTIDAINRILCLNNTILFFDEPDAFLHPQRQREILPYLSKQFRNRFNNEYTQLIITTHSPFVAQSVEIDNILLFKSNNSVSKKRDKGVSYVTINENLFGVHSEYSREVEKTIIKFQNLVNAIISNEKVIDNNFFILKDKLIAEGEAMEILVNYEVRKLIKEGLYNEENV